MTMAINWQIGDRIEDRWEIHRILRGGMGIVYVVYDNQWHEPLAAKTFQDEVFARNPTVAELFTKEAIAWTKLDVHQNVTTARFVQKIESKPFLFLEYVSGGDLGGWIGTPRLTEDLPQVLRFAIQFCDGMNHARSKGITAHRDIKPQNCLIKDDSTLSVTDFGLARIFATDEKGGGGGGTPAYMSPEQWDDFGGADVRSDIYSFGVMLFQMVTGKLPFVGPTWNDFKRLHKIQPAPDLSSPHAVLNALVETCLAKDPAHRFADFSVLRDKLAQILTGLTSEPAPQPAVAQILEGQHWYNKGLSLYSLERFEEALSCFDRALEIDPRLDRALFNKGTTLGRLGRKEEAFACLDLAIELIPSYGQAWINKGNMLSSLREVKQALECYDRALELSPLYAEAWNNKGNALHSLAHTQEALACFSRALELNPRHELAWTNKGGLLLDLMRFDEALACFAQAVEVNPYRDVTWFNMGAALAALERNREALVCYDRALQTNPRFERVWTNKGNTLSKLGHHKEALGCYDSALKVNKNDAMAWFNKGVTLVNDFRLYREALVCFEEALRLGHLNSAQAIGLCRRMLNE
jgi:tetratricopeptide (TPR) repeat protein